MDRSYISTNLKKERETTRGTLYSLVHQNITYTAFGNKKDVVDKMCDMFGVKEEPKIAKPVTKRRRRTREIN